MKSTFEIITILVFLFIVTLFQKMDEGYCDNAYDTANMPPTATPTNPANNNTIIVTASYKDAMGNGKPPTARLHPTRSHKG